VEVNNPEGLKVFAGLFVDDKLIASAQVIDGKALIKAPVFSGDKAYVAAWFDGGDPFGAIIKGNVNIVKMAPDIWKPTGYLNLMPGPGDALAGIILMFAADVKITSTSKATAYGVSAQVSEHTDSNRLIVTGFGNARPAEGNDKVVVSDLKYPGLFPSYNFTFIITVISTVE